jgi:predicted peptidase
VRRTLAVLVPLTLAATAAVAAPASAAPPPPPRPVDVEVITEVLPTQYAATAIAIEYDRPFTLAPTTAAADAFTVSATLAGQSGSSTGPRTVTRVYSNDEPARQSTSQRGDYLIVELAEDDPNARVTYWDAAGITRLSPLDGAFQVTQTRALTAGGGVELAPPAAPMVDSHAVTPVADEFSKEQFTSQQGVTLSYRLFQPQRYRDARPAAAQPAKYPLVVALHGFGERGGENTTQIVANQLAYAFAQPDRQRTDPSFVIAPQAPTALPPGFFIWNPDQLHQWLLQLVKDAESRYPIDPDRVYLTGLSMGSMGAYALLPKASDVFAGALLATGMGNPADAPTLAGIPLWANHSVDDDTIPYATPFSDKAIVDAIAATGAPVVYGEWPANLSVADADAQARALWNQARSTGSHTLFTTYPAGTTPTGPHASWIPMYLNDVELDWLFSQRRS